MKNRVLIADDNRLLRAAHSHALRREGYEVIQAGDGEETLRLAREVRPDLIVLDLLMPKIGGVDVLNRLKQHDETAHIPVIIVSGLSQSNENKLAGMGAAAYCEKNNLAPRELPGFVQRVLQEQGVCRTAPPISGFQIRNPNFRHKTGP